LRCDRVRIAVSSRKQQAADQAIFRHLGVDPGEEDILVLKSSVHFRADFQEMASEVIVVEAPGYNWADTSKLDYRRLRKGMRTSPKGREA
jgi:microcystin degradation protein MlrC